MKFVSLAVLLACVIALVSAQWSNTDHEIFDIQAALEKDEGAGASFYSIMNITRKATMSEINRAYRKTSVALHPDKHRNDPRASKRFERLGVVIKILRDERRDRYDHFLTNGFPRWRGSGYFYARFRPGLGSVVTFLILITSSIQLLVKRINYNRDRKRLENLQASAKLVAWGPRFRSIEAGFKTDTLEVHNKSVIVAAEKKVRVPLSGFDVPALSPLKAGEDEKEYWDADEKLIRKVLAKGNSGQGDCCDGPRRFIDALVTKELVYVVDPVSKELMPLDEQATPKPSAKDTWPFALVRSAMSSFAKGGSGSDLQGEEADGAAAVALSSGSGSKKANKKKKKLQ